MLFTLKLMLVLFLIHFNAAYDINTINAHEAPLCNNDCKSPIYCQGELLKDVQLKNVTGDSKVFVNLKLLKSETEILAEYAQLKAQTWNVSKEQLTKLVNENFANDSVESCDLKDFQENPSVLQYIADSNYKQWVKEINGIWKELAVKVPSDVEQNPDRHSYINIPNCFIKAGGDFEEMYYWDSLWIVRGLLLSDMTKTARGIIENMLYLVDKLGFVPNGNRIYFLHRSQLPILIRSVHHYYEATNDTDFLVRNIHLLEKEFKWWFENRSVNVTKNGITYKMARYHAETCTPRPEAYRVDFHYGEETKNEFDKCALYTAFKSAAESGWDFSSRELRPGLRSSNPISLLNCDTPNMIFVELNSILEFNARQLSQWFKLVGNKPASLLYREKADQLLNAIQGVFWHEVDKIWYDWDMKTNTARRGYYPSNFAPLWTHSYGQTCEVAEAMVQYLERENIIRNVSESQYYGIPTSKVNTTQQWDFRNVWAPLMSIVIEGLWNTSHPKGQEAAFTLARSWIKTAYVGYQKHGKMFEKYDIYEIGASGSGGQYSPQAGFGWTNGFCMILFRLFGSRLKSTDLEDFTPAPAEALGEN